MRKLLVLLVALVAVASFAAVSFSGRFDVTPKLTYNAGTGEFTASIGVSGKMDIEASNKDETTGFYVYIGAYPSASWWGYVWQKLYVSENFTLTLKAGNLERGWSSATGANFSWIVTPPAFTMYSDSASLGLTFDIASGDLKDSLSVFVYTPAATQIDADVFNKLDFSYLSLGLFVQNLVSKSAASELPLLGLNAAIDLAKALNIEGAILKGFGYMKLDPSAGSISGMLSDYLFGVDFGIEKLNGSIAFQKPNMLGFGFKTTILSPVTIGADIVLPNLTSVTTFNFAGYASWKTGLISHRVHVKYVDPNVELGWRLRVTF